MFIYTNINRDRHWSLRKMSMWKKEGKGKVFVKVVQ